MRRRLLLGTALALPVIGTSRAQAAWRPDRPIRMLVPFAAGGVADLTARAVASRIAERLGQPVVIDNRPGAGGIVAGQALMGQPADGHTLLVASNGTAISRALFRTLPFDPLRDFAPVVTMGAFPIAVVNAPNSPDATIAALLARLRANPGRLNIGTISAGSTQNLSAELFKIRSNTRFETIAFPATPQLMTALLRGDVDAAFEITGPIAGQVSSGAIRVLATTAATRAPTLPDVPTLMEAGVPDYDVASWNAIVARTGTPAEAIAAINAAVNEALSSGDLRQALTQVGVDPRGGTVQAMGQLLAADTARWAEVIEKAGIERQ
ncbi:Bug family tripartite tricarboxylate transporter substrate binding protein [Falsiroseomonas stagni]|uniref:Tripartite-type tricarboxylate transporter, receptor component TctC n=1 Tax=Falsiroseomonas stagni DSM 19981 TaxID=1123062 RepID=A0A1I3Y903_9PROT|nr:tripartite tricarboxylate transporter substrate-binding protein [Falsiroseomonas stagni]SFK28338.1 Tripartite-type tricarboxylate transporter, receptor component TctC [Falsiroseomonas stagni DSM 19981]